MKNIFRIKPKDFKENLKSIYKFVEKKIYEGQNFDFFYELKKGGILEGFYLQKKGIIEVESDERCPAKLLNKLEKLSIKK